MTEEENLSKMEHYLAEAMEKNPTFQALHIRSRYLTNKGKFEEARAATEEMVALNPSDPLGYKALGRAANRGGYPAQGLDAMLQVRKFNPRGDASGSYAYRIGESLFLLGRYEEAADEFVKYTTLSGDNIYGNVMLVGIYGQLGRKQEAKAALDLTNKNRVEKGKAPYTLANFDGWAMVQSVRDQFVEGMRKGGMPPGD